MHIVHDIFSERKYRWRAGELYRRQFWGFVMKKNLSVFFEIVSAQKKNTFNENFILINMLHHASHYHHHHQAPCHRTLDLCFQTGFKLISRHLDPSPDTSISSISSVRKCSTLLPIINLFRISHITNGKDQQIGNL